MASTHSRSLVKNRWAYFSLAIIFCLTAANCSSKGKKADKKNATGAAHKMDGKKGHHKGMKKGHHKSGKMDKKHAMKGDHHKGAHKGHHKAAEHPGASHKKAMHGSHWGYVGNMGPNHWGELSSKYGTCKTGRQQSPIDLQWTQPLPFGSLKFAYSTGPIKMSNNGHSIQVDVAAGSHVSVRGQKFDLLSFHFHSLSEHTIAKHHYPLAMHLVHRNAKGELAVVGVMFKEGEHNTFLSGLWQHLPGLDAKAKEVKDLKFNPRDLVPKTLTYYSYKGSLTTPPCSENVLWSVLNTAVSASPQQIKAFRKFYKRNYRPTQPLHGRTLVNY